MFVNLINIFPSLFTVELCTIMSGLIRVWYRKNRCVFINFFPAPSLVRREVNLKEFPYSSGYTFNPVKAPLGPAVTNRYLMATGR